LEDYKKGLHEKKLNIDDDFIKFIKFGQNRIEQTGCGILAFISNNTYIDGITHRRMRESLMETFSDIYILDLHGSIMKKETCPDGSKDVNVFDIQQGVCIGIFIKEPDKEGLAKVHHADIYGSRKSKYEWLSGNDIRTTGWEDLEPKVEHYFFVPKDFSIYSEYSTGMGVNKIFPLNKSGLQTDRDTLFFDFEREELEKRIKTFYSNEGLKETFREHYRIEDSSSYDILSRRTKTSFSTKNIHRCVYRPFEERWLYYAPVVTSRPAWDIMKHILGHENVALIGMRQFEYDVPEYCYVFITKNLTERRIFISNRGAPSIFPLYLYPGTEMPALFEDFHWPGGKNGRVPNLSPEFVEEFAEKVKMEFVTDGVGDLKKTFGPEDVFDYVYGALHSPEYRRRYAEFLKIDFPRVPMPTSKQIFRKLSKVGEELVKLHLMEEPILEDDKKRPEFPVEGSSVVEKGYPEYVAHADRPKKGKVYINKDQYFEGVKPEVWEFHIGGYQVCEKWLKDRRGRKLSYDDISHYQKIVMVLGETIRLMKEPCLAEMFE